MQTSLNSNVGFTSVTPVLFYKRNKLGAAELIKKVEAGMSDAELAACEDLMKAAKNAALRLLRGPIKTPQQDILVKKLASVDPDYNYLMAKSGNFWSNYYTKQIKQPASKMLKFVNDGDELFLFTGPQALSLSIIGENIGKIKKKCLNLTAIAYGIPPENTLKGRMAVKWNKSQREFLSKKMVETEELKDIRHSYGRSINYSIYSGKFNLTSHFDKYKHERKGVPLILNFLLNADNEIENIALTALK